MKRSIPNFLRAAATLVVPGFMTAFTPTLSAQSATGRVDLPAGTRVVLVTGSTDGLGREVALWMADSGAHVIVHGRNRERGAAVVSEIRQRGKGSARFYAADFGSLDQVRELAASIRRDYHRLDALVNNAGIWLTRGDRQLSADGHELHFAVNYLASFALTHELLPLLRSSAPSRIVNVSSIAQTPLDFQNVMLEQGYSGSRGYAQSKLAQVLFTFDLAKVLEGTGVAVNALHPATMMNTSMVAESGMPSRTTVQQGATAVVRLLTEQGIGSGKYFNGTRETRANEQAYDETARARLRTLSDSLIAKR